MRDNLEDTLFLLYTEASKLVQDPKVVNLKKREKQIKEENIHAQRNEELLCMYVCSKYL